MYDPYPYKLFMCSSTPSNEQMNTIYYIGNLNGCINKCISNNSSESEWTKKVEPKKLSNKITKKEQNRKLKEKE